jgi:hypothetical protein
MKLLGQRNPPWMDSPSREAETTTASVNAVGVPGLMVWSTLVNSHKHRYVKQAKDADRPEPKGNVAGHFPVHWKCTDKRATGGKAGPNLSMLLMRNTVSLYLSLFG